ncbi:hypothetical protein PUNSTDRAFT_129600 [Punctularia strigosozonata HHB-11173 SS5]|uniref:uncharacterized protein n=1 Tax=Punctularia strigosozonata (strain HHB-11173) TaxID=741275 RepID=UPI0004418402|nr:uncharacterized protein PUNSTDRAFT_129600 [Punctularia strigosozonata HHB-11173 SS5]EIN13935.1 hypothetical protein PUNSTDRAFT_129600 [Punctularia strigosozonata HHB-11173 SS5]
MIPTLLAARGRSLFLFGTLEAAFAGFVYTQYFKTRATSILPKGSLPSHIPSGNLNLSLH